MRGGVARFDDLEVLVLDEADRMMDMGFWPDVTRIVQSLPTERQTLLFSATIPDEVMSRAREIVRESAVHRQRHPERPRQDHHPRRRGAAERAEGRVAGEVPAARARARARVRAHQARRRPPRLANHLGRRPCRRAPRRPHAGATYVRGRGSAVRALHRVDCDRPRRARPRHRRHHPRHQLRGADHARRVRAPRGAHRARATRPGRPSR